jgi:HD-GYP domain-containing protein (c-di-GMP phosphodiesterase class II)
VLSALPLPRVLHSIVPLLVLQAVLLALIVALGASALAWPSLVPSVPAPRSPPALALLASGMAMYALLIVRALRTFLLTQRALDMAVVVGLAWLAVALVPALTMDFSYLAWWIGHEIELDGILLVGIAVGIDLARAAQSRPLAGDLGGADLVAGEDVFLGSHVRALTVRLAEKDEYTERHTRRVALRAVQVGEVLGLSRARLRELAIGALVHDIGKLSVPDAILKKPGALDDDEFAVIRRHPEWGAKLLAELGGFSERVRELVLDHHERIDGAGYPRGLRGGDINLDTRILTACDVYDALRSKRVYRDAWTHDEAMALLRREIGTAFDGRCVDALERVLEGEERRDELRADGLALAT